MHRRNLKGVQCTNDCCQKSSVDSTTELPAIPPTRLIANIINALFTVFPKLEKKLNKQRTTRMLTMMTVSGMIGTSFRNDSIRDPENRVEYVEYMIQYNDDVRSIARFVGIQPNLAVDFVRSCFNTNKSRSGMYPYTPFDKSAWRYHKRLVTKFGDSIAGYITESIVGVIPAHRITDHFELLSRISRNMAQSSSAKFFILEGCSYAAAHEDQQLVRAPGQAEMIFIDEFINYLRELDEVRYAQFSDEIAKLLEGVKSPFIPNCSTIIEHLNMSSFDEDIAAARVGFKKLLSKPKPKHRSRRVLEPESKEQKGVDTFSAATNQLSRFILPAIYVPGIPALQPLAANGMLLQILSAGHVFQPVPLPQPTVPSPKSPREDSDQEDH